MGPLNSSTSANVSCTNPIRRVIEALEVGDVLPALSTLMGGWCVTVAQYRAYLDPFGGADIPSVAAFRERALDGLRKAGCRRSEGGHDSGEAPRRAAGLPISGSQLNDG